jgi:outer membrane protein TolC
MMKKTVMLFLILLKITFVFSQKSDSSPIAIPDIEKQIPSLDAFIDSAVKLSPEVAYRMNEESARNYLLKVEKRNWTRYLTIQASYLYGMYDNVLFNNLQSSNILESSLQTTKQSRYLTGISLNIPIESIVSRPLNKKIAAIRIDQAKDETDLQKQKIKEQVSEYYYNMILAYKVLVIKANVLDDVNMTMMKAEQDFKDGKISLSDMATIKINIGKSLVEYETARTNFNVAKLQLQTLTGIPINIKTR